MDSVKDNSLSHDEKPSLSKDTDNKENLGEEESSVCNHSEVVHIEMIMK